MKLRVGACALMLVLAGCSGESPEAGMAGMRGVAASKPTGEMPTVLPLARAIGASIANAPDRGALLSYPDRAKPAKQEGAYTWYPAAISEAHAFRALATGEMTVPAPDGSQVKLRYERHVEEIDGNWTWIGRVVGGDPMQEAIITFGEKAVFGSIPQVSGKPALSLQTRNGAVFAVQTDPSKVVSATKGHEDMMIPEASSLRASMAAVANASPRVSQGATAVTQAAPPSPANTVDVAFGYTPDFASANGGTSGANTRLVYLVQVGNQAFSNSDINGYLRIVNTVQVNYTSTNSNQTALQELTGSTGNSPVSVPATLAPLRTARDQYGADIAVLIRKFNTPENQGCGIAWLNGANQTAITSADAAWGYAVISDGYDAGSDGKTYYCADETLVHEAAHLMGSAHDRANSTGTGGALQYGRFPYSFGYKTSVAAGNFYTVMAYGDTGQIAHRIFSTPLKSTCGGSGNLVCGVANSEDNARSLNQMIPIVAQFRNTVVPMPIGSQPGQIQGANGRCLDVVNGATAAGTPIQMWPCNGVRQQDWSFTSATGSFVGSGTSNKVIDVAGYGTANGSGIQLWDGLNGLNQSWRFTNIIILGSSGRVLDAIGVSSANGTRLQLWDSLNGANQVWNFDPRTGAIVGIGGKCLDVDGFNTGNGAVVQLWECTGSQNQKWSLGPAGSLIGSGGRCLDAVNGGTSAGTPLQMWQCNGGPQQVWALRGEIRGAQSNRCLDDYGGGTGSGSRVAIHDCHGGFNQQWTYLSR